MDNGTVQEGKRATYDAYKPSSVEWLEDTPDHWDVCPAKYAADFINGVAFKPTDWSSDGVPIIRIENLNGGEDFNYYDGLMPEKCHVHKGDLLFGWSGNRGTSFGPFIWWREGLHYLNQHIFRLDGYACDKVWLYWTLKGVTFHVEKQAHGIIGMVHVTKGDLGTIKLPVVPWEEQRAIAAFLDRETARIDALIVKKQRQIELLQEKRAALISHAVTKGLNAKVKMKESGIEWLGEIPSHWRIGRLRFDLLSIEQGWSPQCDNILAESDEWGVLKVGCVNGPEFDAMEHKRLPDSLEPRPWYEIKPGDILMSRANTRELLGSAVIVREVRPRLMLCDKLYRIRLSPSSLDPEFAVLVFGSHPSRHQFERDATGTSASMKNIGQDTIKELIIARPPVSEQKAIVAEIAVRCSQLDMLMEKVDSSIEQLREYRTALISAAVTGKIDVRNEVSA